MAAASSSASSSSAAAHAAVAAEEASVTATVPPKADLEASTVSTSASSDDEHAASSLKPTDPANFQFSKDAAEFVPTPTATGPSPKAFNFNPGAREFQPIIPITTTSPLGGKGGAPVDLASATQEPPMGPQRSGTPTMALLQPVPVVTAQGMGVYPVMALSMPAGPARPKPIAYVSPVSPMAVSSPIGPLAAVGFPVGMGGYNDSPMATQASDVRGKGSHKGGGSFRRQGYGKGGHGHYDQRARSGNSGFAGGAPYAHPDAAPERSDEHSQRSDDRGETEQEQDDAAEGETQEEKKDPSKKSWADIARESMAKAAAAGGADPSTRALPKRVPKKAPGPAPGGDSVPSVAVSKAVSWGPPGGAGAAKDSETPAHDDSKQQVETIDSAAADGANLDDEVAVEEEPAAGDVAVEAHAEESAPAELAASEPAPASAAQEAALVWDLPPLTAAVKQKSRRKPSESQDAATSAAAEQPHAESAKADSEAVNAEAGCAEEAAERKDKKAEPPSWAARLFKSPANSATAAKQQSPVLKPASTPNTTRAPWAKPLPRTAGTEDTRTSAVSQEPAAVEASQEASTKSAQVDTADATEMQVDAVNPPANDRPRLEIEVDTPVEGDDVEEICKEEDDVAEEDTQEDAEGDRVEDDALEEEDEEEEEDDVQQQPQQQQNNACEACEEDEMEDTQEEEAAEKQEVKSACEQDSAEDPEEDEGRDAVRAEADAQPVEDDGPADAEAAAAAAAAAEATPPGQPDASGVIRYSAAFLRSLQHAAGTQGPCPETIPEALRLREDGESSPKASESKRYSQFQTKAAGKDLCSSPAAAAASTAGVGSEEASGKGFRDKESRGGGRGSRSGGGRASRGSDSWRQDEQLPKLTKSENSWGSKQQVKSSLDDDAKVTREMKSILNKLTIEKFDTLYQKLLECGISTRAHIETLMREVFEKATMQHHFIGMYTDLCIKLNIWLSEQGICGEDGERVNFKRILLDQCQHSFETYLKPPAGLDELTGDDQFEAKMKYKTKMLGNMKLVGLLLCNKVLSSKIIGRCTEELIHYKSEETLETLCAFLETIGPAFDTKEWKAHALLEGVFHEVKGLCADKKIPARIRCLLKDVLDLRAAGWQKLRPSSAPEGPMRMAEVKSQWVKDNAAQDKRATGGKPSTPSGAPQGNQGEWETVAVSKRGSGGSYRGSGDWGAGAGGSGGGGGGRYAAQDRERERERPQTQQPPSLSRSSTAQFPSTPSWGSQQQQQQRSTPKGGKDFEWRRSGTDPSSMDRTGSGRERPSLLSGMGGEGFRLGPGGAAQAWRLTAAVPSPSASRASTTRAPATPTEDRRSADDLRKQVSSAVRALAASHDVEEAVRQVRELNTPSGCQKDLFVDILSKAAEVSASNRPPLWSLLVRLFSEDVFQRPALLAGMEAFMDDVFEDLKCDVPKLPTIITEELLPALSGEAGLLPASDASRLQAKASGGEDDDQD